jgi:hypothetical protein
MKRKSLERKYMDASKIQTDFRMYSINLALNTTILKILPYSEMYVFTNVFKMKQEVARPC